MFFSSDVAVICFTFKTQICNLELDGHITPRQFGKVYYVTNNLVLREQFLDSWFSFEISVWGREAQRPNFCFKKDLDAFGKTGPDQ